MLNIETSQLIIIDIQERLVNAANNGNMCAKNASKLSKAANILKIPTIITEQYPKGLGKTVENIDTNSASTIEKTSFSAFSEPEFKKILESNNKKQIIIMGIETHICVLQTSIELIKNGYDVYIVSDASSSRNISEHNTGIELLRQYGAKVVSTEIVLFEWLKTSKHPNFKEIQALIK